MKKSLVYIILFLLCMVDISAQIRYIPQQVPDLKVLQNGLNEMQRRYDSNKKRIADLKKWIIDNKSSINDSNFNEVLNVCYNKLDSFTGDLAILTSEIDAVENDINRELLKYNDNLKKQKDPNAYWEEGQKNINEKHFDKAILNFTQVLTLLPKYYTANLLRGMAYFNLGKYSHALNDFDKFIENEGGNEESLEYRAWSKYYLEDYYGSIKDFSLAIELNSNNSACYYGRASSKSEINDFYGAKSDYETAIRMKRDFSMHITI